jgi:tetratricopeptide (TPR) repeat protein
LIDTLAGRHLWADRFEGGVERVFELQDRVASSVAGTISSKLEQAEIERLRRKPTESLDAYDCYLRGLANLHRMKRRATDEALTLFYTAIELDSTFASAYAMAALCRARRLVLRRVANREEEQAEAERLARRAARLGADDATALSAAAIALIFANPDFDGGVALVEHALMLNPNLGLAWIASGSVSLYTAEPDLAIAHFEHAMRLNPTDLFIGDIWQGIALAHLLAGRYDQSLSASERGLPSHVGHLNVLAACSALAGRMDKARDAVARIRERDPTHSVSTIYYPFRRPEDFAKFAEGL